MDHIFVMSVERVSDFTHEITSFEAPVLPDRFLQSLDNLPPPLYLAALRAVNCFSLDISNQEKSSEQQEQLVVKKLCLPEIFEGANQALLKLYPGYFTQEQTGSSQSVIAVEDKSLNGYKIQTNDQLIIMTYSDQPSYRRGLFEALTQEPNSLVERKRAISDICTWIDRRLSRSALYEPKFLEEDVFEMLANLGFTTVYLNTPSVDIPDDPSNAKRQERGQLTLAQMQQLVTGAERRGLNLTFAINPFSHTEDFSNDYPYSEMVLPGYNPNRVMDPDRSEVFDYLEKQFITIRKAHHNKADDEIIDVHIGLDELFVKNGKKVFRKFWRSAKQIAKNHHINIEAWDDAIKQSDEERDDIEEIDEVVVWNYEADKAKTFYDRVESLEKQGYRVKKIAGSGRNEDNMVTGFQRTDHISLGMEVAVNKQLGYMLCLWGDGDSRASLKNAYPVLGLVADIAYGGEIKTVDEVVMSQLQSGEKELYLLAGQLDQLVNATDRDKSDIGSNVMSTLYVEGVRARVYSNKYWLSGESLINILEGLEGIKSQLPNHRLPFYSYIHSLTDYIMHKQSLISTLDQTYQFEQPDIDLKYEIEQVMENFCLLWLSHYREQCTEKNPKGYQNLNHLNEYLSFDIASLYRDVDRFMKNGDRISYLDNKPMATNSNYPYSRPAYLDVLKRSAKALGEEDLIKVF